ncbi:MAG: hypothetical protein H6608_10495 [Flavobacteriales bacterium]|nr:hypothetical protein [Flavobacteriales bacterium]
MYWETDHQVYVISSALKAGMGLTVARMIRLMPTGSLATFSCIIIWRIVGLPKMTFFRIKVSLNGRNQIRESLSKIRVRVTEHKLLDVGTYLKKLKGATSDE